MVWEKMYSLSSLNMISVKAIKERGSRALDFFSAGLSPWRRTWVFYKVKFHVHGQVKLYTPHHTTHIHAHTDTHTWGDTEKEGAIHEGKETGKDLTYSLSRLFVVNLSLGLVWYSKCQKPMAEELLPWEKNTAVVTIIIIILLNEHDRSAKLSSK